LDVQTGRCYITTQNHGYSVSSESLAETKFSARFVNINDKTIEGISHAEKAITGVQWHPESSPGPYDTRFLFDQFMEGTPAFWKDTSSESSERASEASNSPTIENFSRLQCWKTGFPFRRAGRHLILRPR